MGAKTVVIILTFLALVVFWSVTSYAGDNFISFGDVVTMDHKETKHNAKLVVSVASNHPMLFKGGQGGMWIPTSGVVEEVWIDEEKFTLTQKEIVDGRVHAEELGYIQIRFSVLGSTNRFIMIVTSEQLTKLERIKKKK